MVLVNLQQRFLKNLINAGSGTEEHPTQAIQDLYTIKKELKKLMEKILELLVILNMDEQFTPYCMD